MGKQMKLTDSRDKRRHEHNQTQQQHMNSPPTSRSPGFTNGVTKNPVFGLKKPKQQPAALPLVEHPQNFSTVHINQTMMISPFLQHPSLTPGQKHYLYTVAEAYSKDHVRKLICQHYLNVLHRSVGAGVGVSLREMNVSTNPQLEMYSSNVDDSETSKKSSTGKTKGQKQKTPSRKRLVLPKIDSHQKRSTELRKKWPPTRNKCDSPKLVHWEEDAEEDSVLSDISSLSLDHEDFL